MMNVFDDGSFDFAAGVMICRAIFFREDDPVVPSFDCFSL